MICNWCNNNLLKYDVSENGRIKTYYECDCIKKRYKYSTSLIVSDGYVIYYDLYFKLKNSIYNLEGSNNEHVQQSITMPHTIIWEIENTYFTYSGTFQPLQHKFAIEEGLLFLMRILNLKAFT